VLNRHLYAEEYGREKKRSTREFVLTFTLNFFLPILIFLRVIFRIHKYVPCQSFFFMYQYLFTFLTHPLLFLDIDFLYIFPVNTKQTIRANCKYANGSTVHCSPDANPPCPWHFRSLTAGPSPPFLFRMGGKSTDVRPHGNAAMPPNTGRLHTPFHFFWFSTRRPPYLCQIIWPVSIPAHTILGGAVEIWPLLQNA